MGFTSTQYLKFLKKICFSFENAPTTFVRYQHGKLTERFCKNISSIYGKEIKTIEEFEQSRECMTSLFSGSHYNPFSGKSIGKDVAKSIYEDYITLLGFENYGTGIAHGSGLVTIPNFGDTKIGNMLLDKWAKAFQDSSSIWKDLFESPSLEKAKSFFDKFKLRTYSLNYSEKLSKETNQYLKMIEETSQKTTRDFNPQFFKIKKSPELTEMRKFYKRQAQELAEKAKQESLELEQKAKLEALELEQKLVEETKLQKIRSTKIIHDPKFVHYKLKNEIVPQYLNQDTISAIKMLSGKRPEILENSKRIFLEEMGYNPNLIKVENNSNIPGGAAFDFITGKIYFNSIVQMRKNTLITAMRHEVDHFSCFADLCKTIGIDKFKELSLQKYPQLKVSDFNEEFWKEAIKSAKVLSREDAVRYTNAFRNYTNDISLSNFYNYIQYFSNDIESRAHDVQYQLAKSLNSYGGYAESGELQSILSKRITSLLTKMKKSDKTIDERKLIQDIANEEILKQKENTISAEHLLDNILIRLENMFF